MPIEFPVSVNQSTLAERAIRALDLKGDQPHLLDGYYQLEVTALDLEKIEYAYLRRELGFSQSCTPPAAAGQFSMAALATAQGENRGQLLWYGRVSITNFSAGAQAFQYMITTSNLVASIPMAPAADQIVPLDARGMSPTGVVPAPRARLYTVSTATDYMPTASRVNLAAGATVALPPFVIRDTPGFSAGPIIVVRAQGLNVSFLVNAEWRERECLQSEI